MSLIREIKEDEEIKTLLSSFSCSQDKDIEYFLVHKAIDFERLSKSRTYLLFSEQELLTDSIENAAIYGYITLAQKVLSVPDSMSNRMRKEIDGLSAKIHGSQICNFPCYLIGQLAKNSAVHDNPLTGKELIEAAESVIETSVRAVGGRCILIECHEKQKLIDFYKENGFSEIARIPAGEYPMVQMIKKISEIT